jgi:hypothetical protein
MGEAESINCQYCRLPTENHRDIEAQYFASHSTAIIDLPTAVPPVHITSTTAPPSTKDVLHEVSTGTSASTVVPLEIQEELPPEKYVKAFRHLRWVWLTIYHRLHLLVLIPNIIAMVVLAVKHNFFKIPLPDIATAVAANVAAAILIRQELVINLLFTIAGRCPRTAPLRMRRILAKIYHLGGVHSGAGIAATIWFTYFNISLLWSWQTDAIPGLSKHSFPFVVAITIIIDLLLISIVAFAHPRFRKKDHNAFEAVHRFAGWLAVLLFWIHLVLLTGLLEKSMKSTRPLGAALVQSPAVYLLVLITVCLIMPWLRLRRVPVWVEPLSSHATRWHFSYTNVELCSAARVTDKPLKEWHAFAAIPEPDGHGFSLIVSKAGDWTKRMIENPPKRLWVRGIPTRGVLHIAPIFNKMVLVATGSGIGPVLSLLSARNVPCRILWSTKDPFATYAKSIVDDVFDADPNAIVYDTNKMSKGARPDMVRIAYNLYRESGAEAVFVVSNPAFTRNIVYSLESRGVPIFAPIFDS